MRRGRDIRLIKLRNRRLIKRFYYWTEIKRRRFDDVLRILSEDEFFISESRIVCLLKENNELLIELIDKKKER